MKKAKFALIPLFLLALNSPLFAAEPEESGGFVVDINEANAVELAETLTGGGEERARAIVAYREANGPFQSVDDLVSVKGIGEAILSENVSRIEL